MRGLSTNLQCPVDFLRILNYFSKGKAVDRAHDAMDRLYDGSLTGLPGLLNVSRSSVNLR
jgi:hypothetical protein